MSYTCQTCLKCTLYNRKVGLTKRESVKFLQFELYYHQTTLHVIPYDKDVCAMLNKIS